MKSITLSDFISKDIPPVFFPFGNLGVALIGTNRSTDSRGEFSRLYDIPTIKSFSRDFQNGPAQISFSRNIKKGTLRGLHTQKRIRNESKIIKCISGEFLDFLIDLRVESKTFCETICIKISEEDPFSLFIPAGFGHGIFTLRDNTILTYAMSVPYDSSNDLAINIFDKKLKLKFPFQHSSISEKDSNACSFDFAIERYLNVIVVP